MRQIPRHPRPPQLLLLRRNALRHVHVHERVRQSSIPAEDQQRHHALRRGATRFTGRNRKPAAAKPVRARRSGNEAPDAARGAQFDFRADERGEGSGGVSEQSVGADFKSGAVFEAEFGAGGVSLSIVRREGRGIGFAVGAAVVRAEFSFVGY